MTSPNDDKSVTQSVVEMQLQALIDQHRARQKVLADFKRRFAVLGEQIDALDAQRDALGAERDQMIRDLVDSGVAKKIVAEISGLSRTKIYSALRGAGKAD